MLLNLLYRLQWTLMFRDVANFWKNVLMEYRFIYELDIRSESKYMISISIQCLWYCLVTGPWKGPYYVVKKIAECDYQIKSVTDECEQIVHFNKLKLCKPGTHFHENLSADIQSQSPSNLPDSTLSKTTPGAVGDSLELVDCDITCSHRPSRTVRPRLVLTIFLPTIE